MTNDVIEIDPLFLNILWKKTPGILYPFMDFEDKNIP